MKISSLNLRKIVLSLSFLLLISQSSSLISKANAESLSLGVYPPITEIEAVPPAAIDQPILIHNVSFDPVTLSIRIEPFIAVKESGAITFPPASQLDDSFLQYVSIWDKDERVTEVGLAPGQEKTLTLHIDILEKEKPSDYYFSVIFINKIDQSLFAEGGSFAKENVTMLQGGIATNILLTIGPKDQAKGSIETFSTPKFLQGGPVPFSLRVKNSGVHRTKVKGTILIKNMFNQTVGNIQIQDTNILSGATRRIENDASGNIVWKESFLLGRYTAILTLAFSEQGPIFTRIITFYAFPVNLTIGFLIAGGLIFFMRKRIFERLHQYNNL